jgi:hypothetical protein
MVEEGSPAPDFDLATDAAVALLRLRATEGSAATPVTLDRVLDALPA